MNTNKKAIAVFLLLILTLMLTVPVFAHGEDPDEEQTATQVPDDDHADEADDHADEADEADDHADEADKADKADDHADEADDHAVVDEASLVNSNSLMVLGGFLGAVFLAGGSGFMFQPRPRRSTLFGLALIGLTGVIHMMVGSAWGDTLLLLNGIGFLGLGALWAMPPRFIPNQKRILAIILGVYTLITFAGYFLTHDHYDFIAIFTKVVEVPLLLALTYSAYTAKAAELKA